MCVCVCVCVSGSCWQLKNALAHMLLLFLFGMHTGWICHIDIDTIEERFVAECEANDFTGDGCENRGRWFNKPVSFYPYWALEAAKTGRTKTQKPTSTHEKTLYWKEKDNIFNVKRAAGLELDVNLQWPCYDDESCTDLLLQ